MISENSIQILKEKIDRLGERQSDLIRQSTEELSKLRRELEQQQNAFASPNSHPLDIASEVEYLRAALEKTNREKELQEAHLLEVQQQFRSYFTKSQAAFTTMRATLQGEPATTNTFPFKYITAEPQLSLDSISSASRIEKKSVEQKTPQATPADTTQVPITYVATVATPAPIPTIPVAELQIEKSMPEPSPTTKSAPVKKPRKIKRLIRRTVLFAIVIGGAFWGWNKIAHSTIGLPSTSSGQVAGASTDSSIVATSPTPVVDTSTASAADNPIINANVSYDNTKWKQTVNPDFQIKMMYPENASAISYTPGDNNLWVARDKGFLVKITKFDTLNAQPLDDWMTQNSALYKEDYSLSKSTFKNMPAWVGKSSQASDTSGTIYFIHFANYIYSVWSLNADATSTKGRWVSHMIDSLQFYTP